MIDAPGNASTPAVIETWRAARIHLDASLSARQATFAQAERSVVDPLELKLGKVLAELKLLEAEAEFDRSSAEATAFLEDEETRTKDDELASALPGLLRVELGAMFAAELDAFTDLLTVIERRRAHMTEAREKLRMLAARRRERDQPEPHALSTYAQSAYARGLESPAMLLQLRTEAERGAKAILDLVACAETPSAREDAVRRRQSAITRKRQEEIEVRAALEERHRAAVQRDEDVSAHEMRAAKDRSRDAERARERQAAETTRRDTERREREALAEAHRTRSKS